MRAIHFVDIENLVGSPIVSAAEAVEALVAYRVAANVRPHDLIVVAGSHHTMKSVAWALSGVRWLPPRSGPNGADLRSDPVDEDRAD